MSTLRTCPLCGRPHEVDDDGTIPTWVVIWLGNEVKNREDPCYLSRERHQRLKVLRATYHLTYRQYEPRREYPAAGAISNRIQRFIHYDDAVAEYEMIKHILVKRGDWTYQQEYLTFSEGERASWCEMFENPDHHWMA